MAYCVPMCSCTGIRRVRGAGDGEWYRDRQVSWMSRYSRWSYVRRHLGRLCSSTNQSMWMPVAVGEKDDGTLFSSSSLAPCSLAPSLPRSLAPCSTPANAKALSVSSAKLILAYNRLTVCRRKRQTWRNQCLFLYFGRPMTEGKCSSRQAAL